MTNSTPSLLARDDTFFGVCQAIGDDFGFNPGFLRAGVALLLFWNPIGALAAYAGAGVVVALSRWLAPDPMSEAAPARAVEPASRGSDGEEADMGPLAVAA